jgi:Zn-dependent protease with chaperone function
MFYLLCISLCFAAMFIVIAAASLALLPLQRMVAVISRRQRPGTTVNLIFIFRILPFLLGVVAAVGLVLPAYLEFEPSHTTEMPGLPLLICSWLGAIVIGVTLMRCWRILRTTWTMQNNWLRQAQRVSLYHDRIPVYRLESSKSLLAVTGILRPRIFMSKDVAGALNSAELEAALAHELSHVRTGDNLKQFILKVTHPPRWLRFASGLDSAWVSTSELAADEGAITGGASALDLSSALVKVGRLSLQARPPAELAASHLVDGCGAATQARAARLRELLENDCLKHAPQRSDGPAYASIVLATLLLIYVVLLTSLPAIHQILEFLVR